MRKQILLLIIMMLPFAAFASRENEDSVYTLGLYGFLDNIMCYDTHELYSVAQELFYIMPQDRRLDADGNDLNEVSRGRFLSLTTRVGLTFQSPVYKGNVRLGGKVETDFTAGSVAHLQVRHANAYVDFVRPYGNDGEKMHHRLTVGQAFHPMTDNMMPDMVSINTGAPFAPYSRTPQIRYNFIMPSLRVTGAALWKFQFTSPVINAENNAYSRMHEVPELLLGVEYGGSHLKVGAQGSWMTIRPRTETVVGGDTYKVEGEHCDSWTAQAYLNAYNRHWNFKIESMYGENVAHHLMCSGYAVTGVDGYAYEYSPLRMSNTWAEISYQTTNLTHNGMFAVFGGYMKNFGTTRDALSTDMVYVKWANNVDQMFRASAIAFYIYHDLKVGLEYEYTGVYYGDLQRDCTVDNTYLVGNHRASLVIHYDFSHKWHFGKK